MCGYCPTIAVDVEQKLADKLYCRVDMVASLEYICMLQTTRASDFNFLMQNPMKLSQNTVDMEKFLGPSFFINFRKKNMDLGKTADGLYALLQSLTCMVYITYFTH